MAEIKGKLVICDRCGEQVFLKTTGDGETDGGWTRWNKFEPLPKGWRYYSDLNQELCPKCNEEYNKIIAEFKFKNIKE